MLLHIIPGETIGVRWTRAHGMGALNMKKLFGPGIKEDGEIFSMAIRCSSCGHRWEVEVQDSIYSQMDLATQPCPVCESYTLNSEKPLESKKDGVLRLKIRKKIPAPFVDVAKRSA